MEISKEEKQAYCDEYFNGMNHKNLKVFSTVTPKGHKIQGYICLKHNRYLGSLLILKVDDEDCIQFIQSFPKIHYFEHSSQVNSKVRVHYAYEKLDGSCLIIYPLLDKNGEVLEYVIKTRGMPVADKHFQDLYSELKEYNHNDIEKYHKKYPYHTLIFELYGNNNQHEIYYKNIPLDIKLIGVYNPEKGFLNGKEIRLISRLFFKENIPLFQIIHNNDNTYSYSVIVDSFLDQLDYTADSTKYDTIDELIIHLKNHIDEINTDTEQILIEGVVINTLNEQEHQNYIKVKTSTIEIKHRSENGIPRHDIIKELNKYFDDHLSEMDKLYADDKKCYWPYIKDMLLEDYPIEYVDNPKTKHKTDKLFYKVWDSRKPSPELDNITDTLINDYPGYNVVDLIRLFAQKYPQLKKQAGKAYQLLEIKLNK